jgi:hypothetical protein
MWSMLTEGESASLCATIQVLDMWSMLTERETVRVCVLPYRCWICGACYQREIQCVFVCYLTGVGYVEHVNRRRDSASLGATLQVLDMWSMLTEGETVRVYVLPHRCWICGAC